MSQEESTVGTDPGAAACQGADARAGVPSHAAFELPAQKRSFEIAHFTTQGGRTIKQLRVGYESHGQLNLAADNAILVCHYFSGSLHCAGKYHPDDALPGYWDAIIGPGKPIDTDRYFVVSADTLCNLCPKDPMVTTVGPATLDPDTGRPYGASFPIVTIRDFVRVQKLLLEHLGVKRLKCVTGPSMGAMQTLEWGAQFPDLVEKLIPVIGAGLRAEPYLIASIDLWTLPIVCDPNWQGGNYFGGAEPLEGLRQALRIITVAARAPGWAWRTFGRSWARPDADPLAGPNNQYSIESALDAIAVDRARYADAAHLVHLVRGLRMYDLDQGGSSVQAVRAPTLLISVNSDALMFPAYSERAAEALQAQGTPVQWVQLDTDGGHLDGLYEIARVAPQIRAFLG